MPPFHERKALLLDLAKDEFGVLAEHGGRRRVRNDVTSTLISYAFPTMSVDLEFGWTVGSFDVAVMRRVSYRPLRETLIYEGRLIRFSLVAALRPTEPAERDLADRLKAVSGTTGGAGRGKAAHRAMRQQVQASAAVLRVCLDRLVRGGEGTDIFDELTERVRAVDPAGLSGGGQRLSAEVYELLTGRRPPVDPVELATHEFAFLVDRGGRWVAPAKQEWWSAEVFYVFAEISIVLSFDLFDNVFEVWFRRTVDGAPAPLPTTGSLGLARLHLWDLLRDSEPADRELKDRLRTANSTTGDGRLMAQVKAHAEVLRAHIGTFVTRAAEILDERGRRPGHLSP